MLYIQYVLPTEKPLVERGKRSSHSSGQFKHEPTTPILKQRTRFHLQPHRFRCGYTFCLHDTDQDCCRNRVDVKPRSCKRCLSLWHVISTDRSIFRQPWVPEEFFFIVQRFQNLVSMCRDNLDFSSNQTASHGRDAMRSIINKHS